MTSLPVFEMKRVREEVAILLNDVWHSEVVYLGCGSSKILWIKLKFSRIKVCLVVGYGPNEGVEDRQILEPHGQSSR